MDFHEFQVLTRQERSTALIITYQPRFVDGFWVLDNCFEEVSLDDDDGPDVAFGHGEASDAVLQPLFEWCATDHIGLDENPGRADFQAKGDGKIPDRPWDFVHLNSVDKSTDGTGDYLVSARHLDTIFRISSRDGSILWRLGGPHSNFQLANNLQWARQHDARFREDVPGSSNTSMTLSFFNNANDGVTLRDNPSKGYLVQLDLQSMTASKVAEYGTVPGKPFIESRGMGNLQQLPNGNTLLSFGRDGAMAEYVSSSSSSSSPQPEEPIFFADMTSPPALQQQKQKPNSPSAWTATNYRTYLVPSSAWPPTHPLHQPPALWTYARTPTNLMTFYVSWNGATDVASYRFWVSDPHPGPLAASPLTPATAAAAAAAINFHYAGSWPRQGFETNFTIGSARPWAFVEALDAQGVSLANSSIVRTYVPRKEDAPTCGKWHCFPSLASRPPYYPASAGEDGVVSISELLPLDGSAALSGGADGESSGTSSASSGNVAGAVSGASWSQSDRLLVTLSLLEHVFALVGLGLCAWWIWGRAWKGWRRARGYERIGDKHPDGL